MEPALRPLPAASADWLEPLLAALPGARIAVCGDCCLDAYWWLDDGPAEPSLETGRPVRRVARQVYSLGGAANVAANAAALGARVELIGMVGADPFGAELRRLAAVQGLAGEGLLAGGADWQTLVYAKPMRGGEEGERLDFGGLARLDDALAAALGEALARAAGRSATVVVNQQVGGVLDHPALVGRINALIGAHPHVRFLVDARTGADRFRGAALKLNAGEAARLLGRPVPAAPLPEAEAADLALALHRRQGAAIFLTRGERGLLLADAGAVTAIPGIRCAGAVDPVGAGDSVVAALAAALAVGAAPAAAARLANCAAAVTVRKLHTTGTASPAEIRALATDADHLHQPELAEDARRARFLPGTLIELVRTAPTGPIRHAIFDHDGTISTLRQGWEAVMEPMMVRAVLGARHDDAPTGLLQAVQAAVRELIDRTTGIQTLGQMQELVGLVQRFGCVPAADILDHHGYKRIYNEALMRQVRERTARLASGELEPGDFAITGAIRLLQRLHARGVRLYLASGTDQDDVRAEAAAMGYAGLFTGGIFGGVGNLAVEAKRDVMDRIMRQDGLDGGALLVVGDGPVEMREGRRRGACCLGVASDELRRWGLDPAKRARLIRAGADLVVGDFTQADALLAHLGLA